jgi:hypothetical protein
MKKSPVSRKKKPNLKAASEKPHVIKHPSIDVLL